MLVFRHYKKEGNVCDKMAKIHSIKIKNFRGIKECEHILGPANFICFVGRGDSCKTSILEAISYALYPNWNLSINDNDFFNCDTSKSLEIEVTLRGVGDNLLRDTKYGLHIRGLSDDGLTICDEIKDGQEKLLTILFKVEKDLEPKWFVTSKRVNQEDMRIDAGDRASFNIFLLSDYLDKHFSWSKGTPLYALLKQGGSNSNNVLLLDEIRKLKTSIDEIGFGHLDTVIDRVKNSTFKFGVSINKTKTSIDIKDLSIKDSKVILHDDCSKGGARHSKIFSAKPKANLKRGDLCYETFCFHNNDDCHSGDCSCRSRRCGSQQ